MDKSYVDINGGTVNPGDVLRYTVVLTNTGVDTATKVIVNDVIPVGTTYLPGTLKINENPGAAVGQQSDPRDGDLAEFDAANNRVRYNLGAGATATEGGWMPVGARASIEFCVTISPLIPDGTTLLNTAVANYSGSVISSTWNITAEASVDTPVYVPDLSVVKTDGGRTAAPGETVVYRIDARNLSNYAQATSVVLTEMLPAHTTFAGPSTWTNVPGTRQYTRNIGPLYPGTSTVVTFSVKLNDTVPPEVTELENIVMIADIASPVPERNIDNNTGRDTTPVYYADISANKSDGQSSARVGELLTYSFTVTNKGPVRVTGVRIEDPLFQGALQPNWTCTAGVGGICSALSGSGALSTTADLATGGYVVYRIAVLVGVCDGLLINRATAFAPNVPDPVPGNNITVDVNNDGDGANLYIYPEFGSVIAGEITTYTIPIVNYGPDVATNVTATFKLPPGMQLNQYVILGNTIGATYDAVTGVWNVGTLQVGSAVTLTIGGFVTSSLSIGTVLTSVLNIDSSAIGNAPIRQYITTTVQPNIVIAGPRLMTVYIPVLGKK
jgi:large repetitive protein